MTSIEIIIRLYKNYTSKFLKRILLDMGYPKDFVKRKKLTFEKSGYYLMNKIDSIDIDDEKDYELAKFLSKKYLKFKK